MKTFALGMLLVALCSSVEFAQSPMQKLATAFSGRWTITDRSEPSAQYPKGLTRHGDEFWHALAGGTPLIEEYHSKSPSGKDENDNAAFWWDATTRKYLGLFCADFIDQGCAPFNIDWHRNGTDDRHEKEMRDEITMTGEYVQDGKKYAWREVFVFTSSTAFTQTLFLGEPGQGLKRAAVISAKRIRKAR